MRHMLSSVAVSELPFVPTLGCSIPGYGLDRRGNGERSPTINNSVSTSTAHCSLAQCSLLTSDCPPALM